MTRHDTQQQREKRKSEESGKKKEKRGKCPRQEGCCYIFNRRGGEPPQSRTTNETGDAWRRGRADHSGQSEATAKAGAPPQAASRQHRRYSLDRRRRSGSCWRPWNANGGLFQDSAPTRPTKHSLKGGAERASKLTVSRRRLIFPTLDVGLLRS